MSVCIAYQAFVLRFLWFGHFCGCSHANTRYLLLRLCLNRTTIILQVRVVAILIFAFASQHCCSCQGQKLQIFFIYGWDDGIDLSIMICIRHEQAKQSKRKWNCLLNSNDPMRALSVYFWAIQMQQKRSFLLVPKKVTQMVIIVTVRRVTNQLWKSTKAKVASSTVLIKNSWEKLT